MSLIQVSNLSFCYEGSFDAVFSNVSFQIDTDWRLGFVGRNGRGKTTFLNLLQKKFPYEGVISSSVTFDYFPFPVPDDSLPALDVAGQVCPGAEPWELLRELSLLQVVEDAIYRPFCTLSPGEAAKCLLCALFLKENNYLLIDEPTNHLDAAARQAVSRYLRGKKGFLLVSHDRAFLDGCTDHILSINKTDITVQKGNFSTWLENKERQDAFELAGNQKLKKEIARLNEVAARTASWSDKAEKSKKGTKNSGLRPDRGYIGHKSAKMMKRAMVTKDRMEDAAAQKASLLKNVEEAEDLVVSPLTHHSSRLLEGRDLVISYGGRPVFSPQTFALSSGQRVAVCGKNGCGKSSLLKLAAGAPLSVSGSLFRASGLIVSYVPQDASFLSGSLKAFIRENSLPEPLFLAILRKLDFSRDMFLKDMSGYSAGQKKKVLLAQSLCMKAHLYIWDEPLNYIDIYSRMQLEALILKHEPTMLFVEHDQTFADHVATGKILL